MFFKKVLFFLTVLFAMTNLVFADGIYDLGSNTAKMKMTAAEKQEYVNLANNFLIRVKNRQFNVLADEYLCLPEETYTHRPLTKNEIQEIKNNFVKGLEADYIYWKTASLAEIGKFQASEYDFLHKSKKVSICYAIFFKIKGKDCVDITTSDGQKLKFAPITVSPRKKGSKLLIGGYYIKLNQNDRETIPVYPNSVWPQDMD